jgi:hypothetical protein
MKRKEKKIELKQIQSHDPMRASPVHYNGAMHASPIHYHRATRASSVWVMAPCSLVGNDRRFGGAHRLVRIILYHAYISAILLIISVR